MRKLFLSCLALFALVIAAPALAHDEMSVAGQVTAVTAKTLQVRMKDGRLVTLEVDGNTRVKSAGKPLGLKALKVGQSVKALGFGDSLTRLTAINVNIEPFAPARPR